MPRWARSASGWRAGARRASLSGDAALIKAIDDLYARTKLHEAKERIKLFRTATSADLRKSADLDVSQRIQVTLRCDGALAAAAQRNDLREMIQAETLAVSLAVAAREGETVASKYVLEDSIDGESLVLIIAPVETV